MTTAEAPESNCSSVAWYLSGSSPRVVSPEGAWTISSSGGRGRLRTRSSSPGRIQSREVSRSRRGRSWGGRSTQVSTVRPPCTKFTSVKRRLTSGVTPPPPLSPCSCPLMTDITTASKRLGFCCVEIKWLDGYSVLNYSQVRLVAWRNIQAQQNKLRSIFSTK